MEQAVKREVGGSVKAVVTRLGVEQEEEVRYHFASVYVGLAAALSVEIPYTGYCG